MENHIVRSGVSRKSREVDLACILHQRFYLGGESFTGCRQGIALFHVLLLLLQKGVANKGQEQMTWSTDSSAA
jgi:hypothetical protein